MHFNATLKRAVKHFYIFLKHETVLIKNKFCEKYQNSLIKFQ